MSEPVVCLEAVSKRFEKIVAVDNLNFEVRRASTTALLGGNGAGKTTTLSMLLGLLLPSAGRITIFGVDMLRRRYEALPRMNFSSPYVDLPRRLTVRENLTVYARLYGLRRVAARLGTLADELQIADLMHRPYGQLSAGQRTRVVLAKALLNDPELLLLDEPTASLDPDTADYVRGLLEDYQRRQGATILLASHNMSEVERLCDDVLMLRSGVLVDQGTPQDLLRRYGRRNMEEVFIDIAREREIALDLAGEQSAR
ncbi:MAG: ABC transporter ATP-binding protein [Pseudomonadota bacterium]|nr:MAG: ABC transporter ATP-binding protein [Pseudomonadota bacterium]